VELHGVLRECGQSRTVLETTPLHDGIDDSQPDTTAVLRSRRVTRLELAACYVA